MVNRSLKGTPMRALALSVLALSCVLPSLALSADCESQCTSGTPSDRANCVIQCVLHPTDGPHGPGGGTSEVIHAVQVPSSPLGGTAGVPELPATAGLPPGAVAVEPPGSAQLSVASEGAGDRFAASNPLVSEFDRNGAASEWLCFIVGERNYPPTP